MGIDQVRTDTLRSDRQVRALFGQRSEGMGAKKVGLNLDTRVKDVDFTERDDLPRLPV